MGGALLGLEVTPVESSRLEREFNGAGTGVKQACLFQHVMSCEPSLTECVFTLLNGFK